MDLNPDENQQSKRVAQKLSSFQTKSAETGVYKNFKDMVKETDSKTDAAISKSYPCAPPISVSS